MCVRGKIASDTRMVPEAYASVRKIQFPLQLPQTGELELPIYTHFFYVHVIKVGSSNGGISPLTLRVNQILLNGEREYNLNSGTYSSYKMH